MLHDSPDDSVSVEMYQNIQEIQYIFCYRNLSSVTAFFNTHYVLASIKNAVN